MSENEKEIVAVLKEFLEADSRELRVPLNEMRGGMWGRAMSIIQKIEAGK